MPTVESSMLRSVEHDGRSALTVTFRSGETYRYEEVPKTLYEALLQAPSKGSFFQEEVRGAFPFVRLSGRRASAR